MKFVLLALAVTAIVAVEDALAIRSLRLLSMSRELFHDTDPERVGGASHHCYRNCVKGVTKECHYNFTVADYLSMGLACGNCPTIRADCFLPGCIVGGGNMRPVTVVNLQLPGPSVQVCEGDRVIVHVDNVMSSQAVTIHWHGMWQKDTPFMDGTPYTTQCPILPHNSFEYKFTANPPGTHLWHAHVGYAEADGLHGSLVVRKPNDPMSRYYDHDLAEHVIVLWHWYPAPTGEKALRLIHGNEPRDAYGFLVNGMSARGPTSGPHVNETFPGAVFHVQRGQRYRFRTIINTAMYCPVQVSIDDHKLLIIASESDSFEPVEVDSYVFGAGERFDFVLRADQTPGNYFVRFRGMGRCEMGDVRVYETAVLRYDNVTEDWPPRKTSYEESRRSGVLLNPVELATNEYKNNSLIKLVEVNSTHPAPKELSRKPDHVIYLESSFKRYENIIMAIGYPQLNDMTFDYPPVTLLTQRDAVTTDIVCTPTNHSAKQCLGKFCTCPMVHPVGLDSLVEVVFVDTAVTGAVNHPMHLHGHEFYVVAEGGLGSNVSLALVRRWNELGLIQKKFDRPPSKDTVSAQAQGYTIVRFFANNPGYWFLHCHLSEHAQMGMAVVLKVGEHSDMAPVPSGFPRCDNWRYNAT